MDEQQEEETETSQTTMTRPDDQTTFRCRLRCVCVRTCKLFATLVSNVDLQSFQLQQNLLIIPEGLFALPPADTITFISSGR